MNTAFATSPVAEIVATTLLEPAMQESAAARLGLADVSLAARYGCKGPGTILWLEHLGLPIPPQPNCWLPLEGGGLVARLGYTEFLVEGSTEFVSRLANSPRAAGVYPIQRQDAAFLLGGSALDAFLRQICSVDFRPLWAAAEAETGSRQGPSMASHSTTPASRPVMLTSMAGVSVTVVPELQAGRPRCRIWCDGSYGQYLWETLVSIAGELGGGAVAPHGFV